MGNACSEDRKAQIENYKNKSLARLVIIRKVAKEKYEEQKPILQKKGLEAYKDSQIKAKDFYTISKLRAAGYAPPNPVEEDHSELQFLSKFEQDSIIRIFGKLSLLEFERRLKKLISHEDDDLITKS